MSWRGLFLRSITIVILIPLLLFFFNFFNSGHGSCCSSRIKLFANPIGFILFFLEEVDWINLVIIVPFQLQILKAIISLSYLWSFIVIKVNQCFYQGWIALFDWFICVSNKLRIFLLTFLRFQLCGKPRLLFLIRIKILCIPTIFNLGNVRRPSVSLIL